MSILVKFDWKSVTSKPKLGVEESKFLDFHTEIQSCKKKPTLHDGELIEPPYILIDEADDGEETKEWEFAGIIYHVE